MKRKNVKNIDRRSFLDRAPPEPAACCSDWYLRRMPSRALPKACAPPAGGRGGAGGSEVRRLR